MSARIALASAAMTAATALAVTAVAPSPDKFLGDVSHVEAAAAQVQADVELAAVVGFYGVGPAFQLASLAGATPSAVLAGLAALTGNVALSETINVLDSLINAIESVSPVEQGVAAPGPSGVYNSVAGLEYSSSYLARILGLSPAEPIYRPILNAVGPISGQRRAYLLALGVGGTSTAIALNDMITAVESGDPNWESSELPGVTGVVAFMIRNPSRPGGGFLSLFTPVTEPLGVNLSNPDLSGPSGGSYISPDKKEILNISITDVAFKYDLMSDAPSTIYNPVSWLNSLVGFVLPTYLIPKEENIGSAVGSVLPGSFAGLGNAILVTADPTGGQGVRVVPVVGPILNMLAPKFADITRIPGQATYITYDSGNLPLLEPFTVVQRLVSYLPGVNIPTPIADALEPALQQLVDVGYQDVQLTYKNGVPTFTRTLDMGGTQAIAVNSPITAEQSLQLPQAVTNALVRGIGDGLLTPSGPGLQLGLDLKPLLRGNPLAVGVGTALESALAVSMAVANPLFDASEQLLTPVAQVADLGLPKTPRAASPSAASVPVARSAAAPSASALASQISASDVAAVDPVTVEDVKPAKAPAPVRELAREAAQSAQQALAPVRDAAKASSGAASTVAESATGAPKPAPKLGRGAVRNAVDSVRSALKDRR